jgi:predicted DCC family thiol-disulfide oxidoreductase YuxK
MTAPAEHGHPGPVLLFDGECGLCNLVVRLLLLHDRRGVLRFAPLQGPAAHKFLRAHGLPTVDFSTLVLVPNWAQRGDPATDSTDSRPAGSGQGNDFILRTDGVIAALHAAGAVRHAAFLALWPRAWRDAGYRLVARWRHKFFGPWRARPLPRPEWAARFLD